MLSLILGSGALFATQAAASDRLEVSGTLAPDGSLFEGELRWIIHNESDVPLTSAELFLYPEIYRENPQVDDLLEPRVYPRGFDPGRQTLDCPHQLNEERGIVTALLSISPPLGPGERREVSCSFTTQIPHKFGSFGRYRNTVTLNGGLHPHVVRRNQQGHAVRRAQPARVVHDLRIDGQGWSFLLGSAGKSGPGVPPSFVPPAQGVLPEAEQSWITVSAHRQLRQQHIPIGGGESLSFFGQPLRPRQKRWIRLAAHHAGKVLRDFDLKSDGRGLVLIEAPLRRRLVEQGSPGVILVSDRFLEMSELLWRYQDIHLAQAMVADRLRDHVADHEKALVAPLTVQGLAWQMIPDYLRSRWNDHVGLEGWLKRLSFLPQVDSLLQAPVFPFADQLFDSPWVADPLRADITRFNRPLRSGRTLFSELSDRVGERSLRSTVPVWLADQDRGSFYELLARRTGVNTQSIAEAWLEEPRELNLRLVDVQRSRGEDGIHITKIEARREGRPAPEELPGGLKESGTSLSESPVEISVRTRPGVRKDRIWLRWDGAEPVATWELRTAGRTGTVQIDPRGRVLELDAQGISQKHDNQIPRSVKVTGYGYFLAFDPTGADLEAYGALNFRPAFDNRHHLLAQVYTDPNVRVGAGLSYVHYFGPRRIGTYRRHRLVASWDFEWLDTRGHNAAAPLSSEFRFSWIFENRTNYLAPTRGQRVSISAFAGKNIALREDSTRSIEESGHIGIDATAITILRLHPLHSLALRGKLGLVAAQSSQEHLDLGGTSGLRGIPTGHRKGRFRASASLEWRHTFVRDLDVQMPLSRLRGFQGALFIEAGSVANDLSTGPQEEEAAVSIGYGLRAFGDWFGVLPAIGGIEIAWSPNTPPGRVPLFGKPNNEWPQIPVQIYIVGSQSF